MQSRQHRADSNQPTRNKRRLRRMRWGSVALLLTILLVLLAWPSLERQQRRRFIVGQWFFPDTGYSLTFYQDGREELKNGKGRLAASGTYRFVSETDHFVEKSYLYIQHESVYLPDGQECRLGYPGTTLSINDGFFILRFSMNWNGRTLNYRQHCTGCPDYKGTWSQWRQAEKI